MANSALYTSLAINHLISNAHSWNIIVNYYFKITYITNNRSTCNLLVNI